MPRCLRTRPTDRPVRPSTATIFQSPVNHRGAAVAGSTAAPNPSNASDATQAHAVDLGLGAQRDSALARPGASSSSRNAVPGGSSSRGSWSASSASVTRSRSASGWSVGRDDRRSSSNSCSASTSGSSDRQRRRRRGRAARRGAGAAATWCVASTTTTRTFGYADRHRFEQRGHEPAGGRADDADARDAARSRRARRPRRRREPRARRWTRRGPAHDRLRLPSVSASVARSIERDAELAFEPGDVGRDVGLHGVQRPRRGRERAVLGHRDEGVQLAQVHRWA